MDGGRITVLYTIGDICELINGGAWKQSEYVKEGIPVVQVNNMKHGTIDTSDLKFISSSSYDHYKAHTLKEHDLIIATVGSHATQASAAGRATIVKSFAEGMLLNQNAVAIRSKSNALDQRYLGLLGSSPKFQSYLSTAGRGAANQVRIALSSIRQFKCDLPSVRVQQRIVETISAYDDLIENNRRRISLLEDAARLLYREWFVRLRFPGHEHVRITDGVPEGWERKNICDVCETVGGGTPSTKVPDYWDGNVTWLVPTDVTNNDCLILLDSERKISEKGLRESSARMVPARTILMTSRASVGYFALMDFDVCTNQGFINIIPYQEDLRMYLLFNLMSRVSEIRGNAKGSTYPEISKGRFREMEVVLPLRSIVDKFGKIATEIIQQVRCLKKSNQRLQNARDLLLPRLMNGEIAL